MKNSGIEWIGEIPDSWECGKLKYVLHSNDGGVWGDDPLENDNDKIVLRSTEQTVDGKWTITNPAKRNFITDTRYYRIIPGDLLITKSSGSSLHIGKTTLADEFFEHNECYYSNFLQRIRLKKEFLPRYAWYILNSTFVREQFAYMQNSTSGLGNITSTNIENIFIPMPSINAQQQIVQILDCKTAYIDKLIDIQQTQIDKLKEYKQSVITEAVTKGLDPTVPMKDSGVEWIGMIPCEWEIRRGKNVVDLLNKPVYNTDDVITCFRDGEVTLRKNRREEGFTFSDKEIGYQGIDVGDLVVHGMDGFAGAIGISDSRGKGSPVLIVLDSKQNKKFLMYYLRSLAYRDIFLALSTGIRVRSCDLRWNKISTLPFLVPSLEEQDVIVKYIEKRLYDIDKLIAITQAKIDKLQEYKKSLIYEYVTGKKEVVQ